MSRIIDLKPITATKNYYHGRYLNIEIVMDKEGRINVSKLMKKYGDTNGLQTWKRNYKNYLLLAAYAERKGMVAASPPPPRDDDKAKVAACQELLSKLGNVVTLDNLSTEDRPHSNDIIGTYNSLEIADILYKYIKDKICIPREYGWVYIITNDLYLKEGFYKIGLSHNIENRLNSLQTASPIEMKVIYRKKVENPLKIEQTTHDHYGSDRLMREWFKIDDINECIEYIDSL